MNEKNIYNNPLKPCSFNPLTGYHRDGYCRPSKNDIGKHLVCAKMDNRFLNYTKSEGNDLSSVVKAGEKWCLCEDRWKEAYDANKAPEVIKNATHRNTKDDVREIIIKEGFKNKENGVGNIFFAFGVLFFIDVYFFDAKFTKSLTKFKFFKK